MISINTDTKPITIVIADDHVLIRKALIVLLEQTERITVIGEAGDGLELIQLLETIEPDVILTDISMPRMGGSEATRIITKKYPGIPVMAISTFNHEYNIIKMVTAGALGHVSKSVAPKELLEAITTVSGNNFYYERPVRLKLNRMIDDKIFDPEQNDFCFHFTPRELEIMRLICMQKTNRDICQLFKISIRTVEGHRQRLKDKTGATTSVGLAMYACRFGLFDPDREQEYLDGMKNSPG